MKFVTVKSGWFIVYIEDHTRVLIFFIEFIKQVGEKR